jgi:hypothetical protein
MALDDPILNIDSSNDTPTTSTGQNAVAGSTNAPTAAQNAADAPASPDGSQPRGFLANIGHVLVNAGGKPAPSYSVDENGKMTQNPAQASPGQMFKNMLVGALHGMAAGAQNPHAGLLGGMGLGGTAELDYEAQQNQQAKGQAQQQFKNQQSAQQAKQQTVAAADAHTMNQFQMNKISLENAALTHDNDFRSKIDDLRLKDAATTLQDHQLATSKSVQDMGLSNGRVISNYGQLSSDDAHDISKGKKVALTNFDGTATVYDVPENPYQTANSQPFDIAQWKIGADGKPTRQVVGTVAAGKANVGQQLMATNAETKSFADATGKYLDNEEKKSTIAKNKAEVGEIGTRVGLLSTELNDKKQESQVKKDWGSAFQAAGGDENKAIQVLQQKYPKSYGLLAASESMDVAKNGEQVQTASPDGTTKTTAKRQRLFTAQAQSGGLTTEQQQATLGRVKSLVAQGQTREQVQAALTQKLGGQTDGVMKWLDSQGAFQPSATGAQASPSPTNNPESSYSYRPFDNK